MLSSRIRGSRAYHLEGVQLLLDLLRQHRRQPITSRNLAPPIIKVASIRVVKLNAGAEGNVTGCVAAWSAWGTFGIRAGEPGKRREVVFSFNCDRIGSTVTKSRWLAVFGRAWCAGTRRISHRGDTSIERPHGG